MNTRKYKIIVIIAILTISLSLFFYHQKSTINNPNIPANNVTSHTVSISNYFNDSDIVSYITLQIKNISSENCFLWVSRESKSGLEPEDLIRKYFYNHPLGHIYSFNDLISKGIIKETEVGYNFLKLLRPNDSINIVLPNNKKCYDFYYSRYVLIKAKLVEDILGHEIPNEFLYSTDILKLTEVDV